MSAALTVYVIGYSMLVVGSAGAKLLAREATRNMPASVQIEEAAALTYALAGVLFMCLVWFNVYPVSPNLGLVYVIGGGSYLLASYWLPRFRWIEEQTSRLTSIVLCVLNGILGLPMLYILLTQTVAQGA